MYLEKIEIQGFKSFAQKTLLQFPKETVKNKGITAIVGPNGSGKSNIADALKWVLGEQSTKTLRAKKSEDVIFSGSDKKARLGLAEVSLYLNNEDGQAAIEYSEIVITRRLYRDGESEYLLNKNKVRLQDIQMLLAKSHIGQRTYSVVGQGMIDYFLVAPPSERKEFFDEAAGVKEYQIKRNQSLNKLMSAHENLVKADLLIQEIEPRLRILSRQMKKLERREEILKELKELQRDYYGNIRAKLEKEIEKYSLEQEALQKNLSLAENDIKTVENEITHLKEAQSRNEIFEGLKNKYGFAMEEKNLLLRKLSVIKGNKEIEYKKAGKVNLIWLEKKHDELKKEKEVIEQALSPLESVINKLRDEANALSEGKHEVERKKADLEARLNALQLKLLPKELHSGEFKAEMEQIYKAYQALLARLDNMKDIAELEEIKKEAREIQTRIGAIMKKIAGNNEESKDELNALKNNLGDIITEKENIMISYNNTVIELNAKREREKVVKESLEKIRHEEKNILAEIKMAKAKPGNEKEMLKSFEKEEKEIEEQIEVISKKLKATEEEINEFNKVEEAKKEKLFALQVKYQEKQQIISKFTEQLNILKINLAKVETKKEELEKEIAREGADCDGFNLIDAPENLFPQIGKLKSQLEIIGGIDPETEKEYNETKERFDFLSTQVDDIKKAIASLEQIITELDATIKKKFEESFNKINEEFQKFFKILFAGGSAKLLKIEEVAENEDENLETQAESGPDEEAGQEIPQIEEPKNENPLKKYKQNAVFGIDIQATPPGKKVTSINILSGGERTLTAIALLCAIISNNPAPFIVLDEVDAALDEANSFKLSNILDELSHRSQFIVITHNRATMHKAELLYGVTMGDDGISKLLSIKLEEAERAVRK